MQSLEKKLTKNRWKRFKDYLKKQTLSDYGQFFLGLTAVVTIFFTNNLLEKVIKVEKISNQIQEANGEVRDISLGLQETLKGIETLLKKEKATSVTKDQPDIIDQENIDKILRGIPSKAGGGEGFQIYLPPNERKQIFESFKGKERIKKVELSEALTENMKVSSYFQNYKKKVFIFSYDGGVTMDFTPFQEPWLESIEIKKGGKLVLKVKEGELEAKPRCSCKPLAGIKNCFIERASMVELVVSINKGLLRSSQGEIEVSCYNSY